MHLLLQEPTLELLHQPELTTLVFRFTPSFLPPSEWDRVNAYIRKELFRSGKEVIAGTKVGENQFLKFTFLNPLLEVNDLQKTIQLIKYYGTQYTQQN
jgi:L-2,4-diaminobutyrate decarboxylase